ncbi:MlaD family protein [Terrimonas pollutisoli]|uniref:MlaD family protein n=1 Tax=Terrimonas pollutisoli TaxID=3034147 RepID=UPI0023EBDAEC|nr:MlaD family protein [Terrimonas sp. H1YJ31]
MAKRVISNIKLGAFVLSGLLFLVLLLYMIGKDRNLFGSTYILKARFENVQGLVPGNNIRFSGIQAGTVKRIKILSDTVIEVTMIIDTKMKPIIRKNAIASIGTDGLVGNKVVNIVPAREPGALAEEGDILASKKVVNTDEMLQTLYKTNNDIAIIADNLKTTVQQINNSSALWALLNDKSIPRDLRISLGNIRQATGKAGNMADNLHTIIMDVKNGKGSVGAILKDTSFAQNLNDAIVKIKVVGEEVDSLANEIGKVVTGIRQDINNGKGAVNALFKDSAMVIKLNASLDNIQKGTDGFNENMEALKHNILLRGYFRKQEKQKRKEEARSTVSGN